MLGEAANDAHDTRVAVDARQKLFWVVWIGAVDIVAPYQAHVELSQRIKKH